MQGLVGRDDIFGLLLLESFEQKSDLIRLKSLSLLSLPLEGSCVENEGGGVRVEALVLAEDDGGLN